MITTYSYHACSRKYVYSYNQVLSFDVWLLCECVIVTEANLDVGEHAIAFSYIVIYFTVYFLFVH